VESYEQVKTITRDEAAKLRDTLSSWLGDTLVVASS
jgi:hypothetical protein